ncbi:MAG: DUF6916 family protein [Gammaproteobacteria bacterium]
MLEALTKENWETYLNTNFQVEVDDHHSIELTLIAVSGSGRSFNGRREAFSLLFQGPHQPTLPQRIYRIRQQHMGQLDIFLVPVSKESDGLQYEAVFT